MPTSTSHHHGSPSTASHRQQQQQDRPASASTPGAIFSSASITRDASAAEDTLPPDFADDAGLDLLPSDADADAGDADDAGPSLAEMRAAWEEMRAAHQRERERKPTAAAPAKNAPATADPYDEDDLVTVLLPAVYRRVIAGAEPKSHRVFISGEGPRRPVDDGQGGVRMAPGVAVTVTFTGGVARHVRYVVAKGWKQSLQFRSNDALRIVPDDTSETTFARLCGVQPMQPQKQAAMLLASDLDAVLAEFDTEQLAVFAQALSRRAAATNATTNAAGK